MRALAWKAAWPLLLCAVSVGVTLACVRMSDSNREKHMGQITIEHIHVETGKPFGVVKFATDVTAQVLASQALQLAVQQTQDVVSAAEQNDLTHRIPLDGKSGEIANLCGGVNGLLDTMMKFIADIKAVAQEVSSASAEISTSTTDLSQRTEEQAASLEETSS